MSYQSISCGETQRFFTVIDRDLSDPIVSGDVNYYLVAMAGDNDGKWWDDNNKSWSDSVVANPMTHIDDGHWVINLSTSPFSCGVKYLEYVKESNNKHIPDKRHVIGYTEQYDEIVSIIKQTIKSLDIEVKPTRIILGPCKQKIPR